jgi:prepilin-type N-terminal cleavage/methylation domain-containing protein
VRHPQQGFTLIELAIVMVILTILASGLLVPLTTSIQTRRIEATNQIVAKAQDALIGYALSHKSSTSHDPYLPCPDLTSGGSGTNIPNDGIEDRTTLGQCDASEGNLPWNTLGVAGTDAWGNRLDYHVTPDYADSGKGISLNRNVPSTQQLSVCTSPSNCSPTTQTPATIAAVIVSHGPNGWGAINNSNALLAAPTNQYELANANGGTTLYNLPQSTAGSTIGEFDDLVSPLSSNILTSRACNPTSSDPTMTCP